MSLLRLRVSPGTLELWLLPAGLPRQLLASLRGRRASGAALAGERAGGALRGAAVGRAACGGAEPQPQALQVRGAPDLTYAHSKLFVPGWYATLLNTL